MSGDKMGPAEYTETELGLLEIDRVAVSVFARAPLNSAFYWAVDRVRKAIAAELSLASAAQQPEGDNG